MLNCHIGAVWPQSPLARRIFTDLSAFRFEPPSNAGSNGPLRLNEKSRLEKMPACFLLKSFGLSYYEVVDFAADFRRVGRGPAEVGDGLEGFPSFLQTFDAVP